MNERLSPFGSMAAGVTILMFLLLPVGNAAAAEAITVSFPTSCSAEVQDDFDTAVTLLHSFEYLETARRFGEIAERDPGCAMARWGAAMSIWHPLWAPPSVQDLKNGAAIIAETNDIAVTPWEKG